MCIYDIYNIAWEDTLVKSRQFAGVDRFFLRVMDSAQKNEKRIDFILRILYNLLIKYLKRKRGNTMEMMKELENCQPELFFQWFQRICSIPHPSYHEEKLCDFLVAFARERGLEYVRDEMHNLLIRLPATEGYEDVPPYLLQSHMDMVPAADEGVTFDFLKDPIQLRVVGNELRATGTTLGADDGGGIAAMLSFVDDPQVKHPALELLFTVQEEVGMAGVRKFDFSQIKSRRMVNFDSGRTHNFCVSSAGSMTHVVQQQLPMEAADGDVVKIMIRGGLGGHAGLDIHKNRACAGNVAGEMLHLLGKEMSFRLCGFRCWSRSIFPCCDAEIVVPAGKYEQAKQTLEAVFAKVYSRYTRTDPDLCCRIEQGEGCVQALSEADSIRVKNLLFLLRTELRKCDAQDQSIVLGSGSLLKASLTEGYLDYEYAIRAVEDSVRDLYGERTEETLRLLGFPWTIGKHYGGWPMQTNSKLVELFDRKHEELFGYPAGHRFVHGGIEVGDIVAAIPDMDAIAINLPMENAHTTNELLYIDRVPEFWALFTAVFAEK